MNKIHKQRLYYVSLLIIGLSIATGLILYALKQNMNAFLTPSQLAASTIPRNHRLRLGGMVKRQSIKRDPQGLGVTFVVTDLKSDITVRYTGVLPDLFREGKGVIALGTLTSQGILMAQQILAKHDENYMPKNVSQVMADKTTVNH
ncbi:MAG: cytochrome c biogenesis protein CcmE [Gammaproteobacteria bacterium RIFCSPHIGHO2_12_FULL_45_12]|nr:MAG: cytochrome c biogenesis protein CcmE [Gammaproteobacteria bacterium RIFCSPHIGHO2_12_FULL_45_12]